MKPWTLNGRRRGIALLEMMVSLTVSLAMLGVLTYASIGISRSLSATERYIVGVGMKTA